MIGQAAEAGGATRRDIRVAATGDRACCSGGKDEARTTEGASELVANRGYPSDAATQAARAATSVLEQAIN